jgi:hypothetical protein
MAASFAIESDLWHDGDGLTRYGLRMANESFSARTMAWGNDDEHLKLSSALSGFSSDLSSEVLFRFGTPGTGTCELRFYCLDATGNLGLWAHFEAEHPASNGQHELGSLFMRCDPVGVDSFVASLRGFVAGSSNRAALSWVGP